MTFLPEFKKFPKRHQTFVTNGSMKTVHSRYLEERETLLKLIKGRIVHVNKCWYTSVQSKYCANKYLKAQLMGEMGQIGRQTSGRPSWWQEASTAHFVHHVVGILHGDELSELVRAPHFATCHRNTITNRRNELKLDSKTITNSKRCSYVSRCSQHGGTNVTLCQKKNL